MVQFVKVLAEAKKESVRERLPLWVGFVLQLLLGDVRRVPVDDDDGDGDGMVVVAAVVLR